MKGKLYATRRIGRPRIRWMDDVTDDLRRIGIGRWMEKARNKADRRRGQGPHRAVASRKERERETRLYY